MLIGLYGAGTMGRAIGRAVDFPFTFVDDTPSKIGTVIDGHDVASFAEFSRAPKATRRLYICIYQPGFSYLRKRDQLRQACPAVDVRPFTEIFRSPAADRLLPYLFFEKAEELLGDVLASLDHDPILTYAAPDEPDLAEVIGDATLIVNATTIGWHGDETPLDAAFILPSMTVYDMVYRPTKLLADARSRGAQAHDGLGMLARQAIIAFEHWTGRTPPLDLMLTALRNA
jgi:hypothetical protein